MEFPHHHHHHHHHRRNDEEEEEQETKGRTDYYPPPDTAPPPPPFRRNPDFDFDQPPPPPPPHQPLYYQSESHFPPPPRPRFQEESNYDYHGHPPPPAAEQVTHVSHDQKEPGGGAPHHHPFRPHLPSFLHHQAEEGGDQYSGGGVPAAAGLDLSNKPTYKVYCKAEPNFHLTIREGKVVLATADPSDPYQNWYKDEKYSTRVKDEEGFPCFALVNKVSGQAIKHSIGASHPVQLILYKPDVLDESVLWTEGKDLGDGYRAVRMVNNVRLNVDAFHGDKKSGGVHDGTTIVLWEWNKGDNQRWKIIHHCKFSIKIQKECH